MILGKGANYGILQHKFPDSSYFIILEPKALS